ncbi:protein PIN-LIKES 7-like [Pistacia vera]|uniref:protein PIN-LIKES 7-like n=1 Tax=Pistacia vera TaxID=55513 RepID=UPI001263D2D9|nr:protein PIN-LIKES 7-like [Pistacia vera]
MPVNIGLTFLFGGILGWIVVKILRPKPYLEGLIIATCASGNLGNLLLIVVPAICNEEGSPFGNRNVCSSVGLSYASFSMALGGFYIWTYSYHLVRSSSIKYKALQAAEDTSESKVANKDFDATPETRLLKGEEDEQNVSVNGSLPKSTYVDAESQIVPQESTSHQDKSKESSCKKILEFFHKIGEELMAPPTIAAGWNNSMYNTYTWRQSHSRYIVLPMIGIWIVKGASTLGFLPSDPLYHYVLMIQFTLPPAMNIGTMTQLFDVAQEECSVLFFWTYLVSALALTSWSTVYMWILA